MANFSKQSVVCQNQHWQMLLARSQANNRAQTKKNIFHSTKFFLTSSLFLYKPKRFLIGCFFFLSMRVHIHLCMPVCTHQHICCYSSAQHRPLQMCSGQHLADESGHLPDTGKVCRELKLMLLFQQSHWLHRVRAVLGRRTGAGGMQIHRIVSAGRDL